MAAQVLHDLDALGDRGAEVLEPLGEIALVDVVRADPVGRQLVHQSAHQRPAVVDATQQHGLIAERDPCVGEQREGVLGLGRELPGDVEVGVDPHRVVAPQHRDELGRDALRQRHRHAGPDPHDLHRRHLVAQAPEDAFEPVVRQQQRVAARQEHVPDLRVVAQPGDPRVELGVRDRTHRVTHLALTGAVTAQHRALVDHDPQDTVRVPVSHARGHPVPFLVERVLDVEVTHRHLGARRDRLQADRTLRVVAVDQRRIVRRHREPEPAQRPLDGTLFIRLHRQDARQLGDRPDPVLHLPAPVEPLLSRHVLPDRSVTQHRSRWRRVTYLRHGVLAGRHGS